MRVKICGITNAEDLLLADAAGADFAGFVLWSGSKRFVPLARLAELARVPVRLRRVGVFLDATPAAIAEAVRVGRLHVAQVYGCAFRRADLRKFVGRNDNVAEVARARVAHHHAVTPLHTLSQRTRTGDFHVVGMRTDCKYIHTITSLFCSPLFYGKFFRFATSCSCQKE